MIFFLFLALSYAIELTCNEGITCELDLTNKFLNVTGTGIWSKVDNIPRNYIYTIYIGSGITSIEGISLKIFSSLKYLKCI